MDKARMTACQHIKALPFFLRLVISILGGVLISCVLFTLLLGYGIGANGSILYSIMAVIFFFLVSLIIATPILALVFIVAVFFQEFIERHLLLCCIAAPIVVWLIVAVYFALEHDAGNLPISARIQRGISGDSLTFLFFSTPSAVLFFLMGRKKVKNIQPEDTGL